MTDGRFVVFRRTRQRCCHRVKHLGAFNLRGRTRDSDVHGGVFRLGSRRHSLERCDTDRLCIVRGRLGRGISIFLHKLSK